MALHCLIVLELGLYAGCIICGIIVAASVTITQGQFDGQCILYGTVLSNATSQELTMVTSSSPSLCRFVTAISACIAVYCFSLTLYWICIGCMGQEVTRGRLCINVTLVICGVFLFFLLVAGCVLRIGRYHLCDSIIHLPGITRCEEMQSKPWSAPYVGTHFVTNLHIAETSVWVNFFFWVLIAVAEVIQRCQGSEVTGSPSESVPFSPHRARPRYICIYSPPYYREPDEQFYLIAFVPDRFVEISDLALREFFTAIYAGRDTDPCWKKSIYKIICKLDSPVPDCFRLPGCPTDMSTG